MTDAADTLLVERFAALADPLDDSDWIDVRRRAAHRRVRARAVLPLAAALLALLVGSAFAYYRDVVDFVGAEKAPPRTVKDFESLAIGAPRGMDPQAIASETRRIETTAASGARRVLFVAPTKAGGVCFAWRELVGGCDKLGTTPLGFSWGGTRDPKTSFIAGHVSARYVARVELRFADGRVLEPPITWVSPPIDQGFFLHEFTPNRQGDGSGAISIVALDSEGAVVTEGTTGRSEMFALPPGAITSEKTAALSISTTTGPAVVWVAPTRYEGQCAWLEFQGRVVPISCEPRGAESRPSLPRLRATRETVLFFGRASDRYHDLELRYADGTVQRVTPMGGFYLIEISQDHLERDTRLVNVIPRDAAGREIRAPWFEFLPSAGTSWDPCFRVLPAPPGTTCP